MSTKDTKKEKVNPNQWKIDFNKRLEKEGESIKIDSLTDKEKKYYISWLDKTKKAAKKKPKTKIEQIVENIKKNAEEFADRFLKKAIQKEEQQKKFQETDKSIIAKVKEKILAQKRAKEERKKALMLKQNKTIPKVTPELVKAQTKIEQKILDIQQKKADRILAKADWKAKRREIVEQRQRLAAIREIRGSKEITDKLNSKRTTKEERIARKKEEHNRGRDAYMKMMDEHAAAKLQMTEEQKKEREKKIKRAEELAKTRLNRIARKTAAKLKQQKITQERIKMFEESQKKRLAKKQEKLAKYSGVPKKVTKEYPKDSWDAFVANAEKKLMETKTRYIIRTAFLNDNKTVVSDTVGAFVCEPDKLSKRLSEAHNKHVKDEPDSYVGIYAYSGVGREQKCVKEMIQDKFLEINGESMSRTTICDKKVA